MDEQLRYGPTLFSSLWRYRAIIIAATLLLGALGYVVGAQEPEAYTASARIFLDEPNTSGPPGNTAFVANVDPVEYVPQQAARLTSRSVLASAVEAEGDRLSLDAVAEAIEVQASIEELWIIVTATDSTAQGAADLANAVAGAYATMRAETERQRADDAVRGLEVQAADIREEIATLEESLQDDPEDLVAQTRIANLAQQLEGIESVIRDTRLEAQLRGDGVETIETAEVPDEPSRPNPEIAAVAAALLGAIISSMWAYWYAGKSQRVLKRTDPERVLMVPPLGEIPLYRSTSHDPLTGLLRVDPAAAEAYEFVLSSIEFALRELDGKSLLITSTLPGDGKTTTTLQLAIAASRDRRRVVLVDADLRARGLTRVLNSDDRVGLADLAALDLDPSEVLRRYRFSERSQLPVVTAGQRRGDPAALLRTHAFRRSMARINDSAELLIVDSSPLLAVADATIVAGSVDGIVLVVSHGTPVSELEKVRERLKFVSTPLLGYVYNRSDSTTAGAYGYGYGVEEDADGERRLMPRTKRGSADADDAAKGEHPTAGSRVPSG